MGNTIIKADSDRRINDTILGKRVQQILRDDTVVFNKGQAVKINKVRACCMGVAKKDPDENEFITVNLPEALTKEDRYCKLQGKCIGTSKLGLQFKNVKCGKNLKPGPQGKCDAFMVNKCAKELYDRGCVKVIKGKNGINKRTWNSKNKNCLDTTGASIYGSEDCACINSLFAGYSLNNDPSNKIKGGIAFHSNYQNPYGINGDGANLYTKYSLDVMGQGPEVQFPQLFDSRCAARINASSVASGMSAPYLLPKYKKNPTVCMNKIQIKDSNIGTLNMKNIKQSNTCNNKKLKNKKPAVEITKHERPVTVNPHKKVGRQQQNKLKKNEEERLKKVAKVKSKVKNVVDKAKKDKKTHQAVLSETKAKHKAVLAETKAKHQDTLAETKDKHQAELAKTKDKHQAELAKTKDKHQAELAKTKAEHQATLAETKDKHKTALDETKDKHKTALVETKTKHRKTYKKILLIALGAIVLGILTYVFLPSNSDNEDDDSSSDDN